MNISLDQQDAVHKNLRRAVAVTRLLAESAENRKHVEVPAKDVGAALFLVLDQLEEVQIVLQEAKDSKEKGTAQEENAHRADDGAG